MTPRSARRALVAVTIVVLTASLLRLVDPVRQGASVVYFSDLSWSGSVIRAVPVAGLSTYGIFASWRGQPPPTFSAAWTGTLIAIEDGTYALGVSAVGPALVYVDRQLVVDHRGDPSQPAFGSIALRRGVHPLFVQYAHGAGEIDFALLWRQRNGVEPLPDWAVTPRPVSFVRFAASVLLARALPWLYALWGVVLAWTIGVSSLPAVRRYLSAPSLPSADAVLIAAGLAIFFFVLPHQILSDGRLRFYALAQLIDWREVSPVMYSMVGPLASAPFFFLGRVVMTPEWWCAHFNTIVFIAGLLVWRRQMRGRFEPALIRRFLLLLIAGSMFPYHLEGYFGEVFTSVLVAGGLLAVTSGHAFAGWTATVIGVINTPASLAALVPPVVWHAWKTRRPQHLAAIAAAAAGIMLESWLRRGSPFISGYEGAAGTPTVLTYAGRPGFSYPFFFGLLSVLFSFGKGLVFYAPGLVVSMRERLRDRDAALRNVFQLWMLFLVGLIVIYSKWWAWYGGTFWGPRFFLFASIPAALAIAVRLCAADTMPPAQAVGVLAALTLSSWVAIDGTAFDLSGLETCRELVFEWLCFYVPEYSPLWRPFVEFTQPSVERITVSCYLAAVYLWLAAPLVAVMMRPIRSRIRRPTSPPTVATT